MTYAQKMLDERRMGFHEGETVGIAKGRTETMRENILALKGLLGPDVISERFKLPLEQVLKILGQD